LYPFAVNWFSANACGVAQPNGHAHALARNGPLSPVFGWVDSEGASWRAVPDMVRDRMPELVKTV